MNRSIVRGLFAFFCASFIASTVHAETLGFSLSPTHSPRASLSVTVVDDITQAPIEGAMVNISDSLESPRQTIVRTDSMGHAFFPGTRWAFTPKAVTVSKDGFTTLSVVGVQSDRMIVYLKSLTQGTREVIASGKMLGWETPEKGKKVYAGLVFKSLSAFDFFRFHSGLLISPLKDTIDVFGKRNIPSNVMFPSQDISFIIGSIHVDKPNYRLPVPADRELRLTAIQGEMLSKEILSLITGGKANVELLNKLTPTRAGVSTPLMQDKDFALDPNLDIALVPRHEITVSPPPFRSDVMVVAVTDMTGDRQNLMPTDIKVALTAGSTQAKPVTLAAPQRETGKDRAVLTVAFSQDPRKVTGILTVDAGEQVSPGKFLEMRQWNDPEPVALPESVSIRAPETGLGCVVFDAVNPDPAQARRPYPVWIVYTLPSAKEVAVPTRTIGSKHSLRGYASVHFDFGNGFDERTIDGLQAIRGLKRFAASLESVGAAEVGPSWQQFN